VSPYHDHYDIKVPPAGPYTEYLTKLFRLVKTDMANTQRKRMAAWERKKDEHEEKKRRKPVPFTIAFQYDLFYKELIAPASRRREVEAWMSSRSALSAIQTSFKLFNSQYHINTTE